jgi:hypothetical protein
MKQDVSQYFSKCLECQQVKVEQKHIAGLLHPFLDPKWKWETISIDFIIGFPKTSRKNYVIMVVVDNMRKVAHFTPIKYTLKL